MPFLATPLAANPYPSTLVHHASYFCFLPQRLCQRYGFEVSLGLALSFGLCLSQRLCVKALFPHLYLLRVLPMPVYYTVAGIL